MKILNSVAAIYRDIHQDYLNLKKEVDVLIRSEKKESWHYFSRVKEEQSYALKLETGRVLDIHRPEDFFACTLVVENLNEITNAIILIEQKFNIKYRKPQNQNNTHKESYSFPFDDLRLYLTIKAVDYLPDNPINKLVFELQLKTFLQHAWGIATHDLIYKSGKVSWPKERVAYQIKAMLEQAEVSISGADYLSALPELSKETTESFSLNQIHKFLITSFDSDVLPNDLLRLSRIVKDILFYFRLDLNDLERLLSAETSAGRGTAILNLSPYSILLQAIINQRRTVIEYFFSTSYRNKKNKLFIPKEIDISTLTIEEPERMIRS